MDDDDHGCMYRCPDRSISIHDHVHGPYPPFKGVVCIWHICILIDFARFWSILIDFDRFLIIFVHFAVFDEIDQKMIKNDQKCKMPINGGIHLSIFDQKWGPFLLVFGRFCHIWHIWHICHLWQKWCIFDTCHTSYPPLYRGYGNRSKSIDFARFCHFHQNDAFWWMYGKMMIMYVITFYWKWGYACTTFCSFLLIFGMYRSPIHVMHLWQKCM